MMNVLILEDEKNAALRLKELLAEVQPDAKVVAVLETVKETVAWLNGAGSKPDIILSDIQLADGLSIDALKQAQANIPVIFTTAYDEYTLKAFKLNSVDYLLKPIDKEELRAAFAKHKTLHQQDGLQQMLGLFQNIASGKAAYKTRFMIRQGDRLITIPCDDVAYVKADDKVVFLFTKKGQRFIIDDPLDDLEQVLDPAVFFRINRTYIAPLEAIDKIHHHFNGRLKITLHNCDDDEIFVSRARASAFKAWLDK